MFDVHEETAPGQGDDLRRYWQILLRRRWIFLTTFVLVMISALVYSRHRGDKTTYRTTAKLSIHRQQPQPAELGSPAEVSKQYYAVQCEIVRSYDVASEAFHRLGRQDDLAVAEGQDPIASFQGSYKVECKEGIIRISASGPDARFVADRVNAVAKAYKQLQLDRHQKHIEDATDQLEQQLIIQEKKVAAAQRKLQDFHREEHVLSFERQREYLEERLSRCRENLDQAAGRRRELAVIFDELTRLQQQPSQLPALPQELQNPTFRQLSSEIHRLKSELLQLSRKLKRIHPRIVELESQLANTHELLGLEAGNVLAGVETEHRLSRKNEERLTAKLGQLEREAENLADREGEYWKLKRELAGQEELHDLLLRQVQQTNLAHDLPPLNQVDIFELARPPLEPEDSLRKQALEVGAAVGLLLGIALCFLFDSLDSALRSEEDVELYLETSALGSVPLEKGDRLGSAPFLRAYRDLRTRLGFYAQEHFLKSLLITSSVPQEGKTTTLVELGKAFAQGGSRVLLIDADMYRPRLRKLFEVETEAGLTDVLLAGSEPRAVIVEPGPPGLSILPSGLLPPNPAEALVSEKMSDLLADLKEDFDLVLIESAPLNAGLETASLGALVDGIALVVRANSTPRAAVQKMLRRLRDLKGNVLGVVLTAVRPGEEELGAYYEAYGPALDRREAET